MISAGTNVEAMESVAARRNLRAAIASTKLPSNAVPASAITPTIAMRPALSNPATSGESWWISAQAPALSGTVRSAEVPR